MTNGAIAGSIEKLRSPKLERSNHAASKENMLKSALKKLDSGDSISGPSRTATTNKGAVIEGESNHSNRSKQDSRTDHIFSDNTNLSAKILVIDGESPSFAPNDQK
jgi:hypothetical protein